jgi:hypothetical protein
MIKQIAAITGAAVCAGLLAGVVPGVAVGNSRTAEPSVASIGSIDMPVYGGATAHVDSGVKGKIACTRNWPYYEKACLHNSRRLDDQAHVVRIIPIDRLTKSAKSQARD